MQDLVSLIRLLEQHAAAVQAFAALVTLGLTTILAIATVRYVKLTAESNRLAWEQLRLAQQQLGAAVEANEAPQRPFITVRQQPRPGEAAIFEAPQAEIAQFPEVQLINLGLGPALNLHYEFTQVDVEQGRPRIDLPGDVPRLAAGHVWETQLGRNSLVNRHFNFSVTYESLSHTRYETTMRIERGIILDSRFGQRPAAP